MIFVEMPADKEIISYEDSTYGVCEPCSQTYNGALAGKKEDTGDALVLQFVHQDFASVADQVFSFAVYLDNLKCERCDGRIYEEGTPLTKIARRILQQCPDAHFFKATCESCQAIHGCACCEEEEDDHD
jgi:hypothetical protein